MTTKRALKEQRIREIEQSGELATAADVRELIAGIRWLEGLVEYIEHRTNCPSYGGTGQERCTCGLWEAVKAGEDPSS